MAWDPLAKQPDDASKVATWFRDQLAGFQASRPDLPQGSLPDLSVNERNWLVDAYSKARDDAQLARRATMPNWRSIRARSAPRTIACWVERSGVGELVLGRSHGQRKSPAREGRG
jgi:hypothetical protein